MQKSGTIYAPYQVGCPRKVSKKGLISKVLTYSLINEGKQGVDTLIDNSLKSKRRYNCCGEHNRRPS